MSGGLPDDLLPAAQDQTPPRRRSGARRALRGLSSVLILAGVLLMVNAGLTWAWQEPFSAIYTQAQQGGLEDELEELREEAPDPVEQRALSRLPNPGARMAFAARALNRRTDEGDAIGRIRIPRIGLSHVVIAGTDGDDLRKGPGHYPNTPLPGAPGTVGVAGHRTTYGAPFRQVDRLRRGDPIAMEMPYGTVRYAVEEVRIVEPDATWVVDRRSYDRLVLTACHPLYSAAQRIVVFARETGREPAPRLR